MATRSTSLTAVTAGPATPVVFIIAAFAVVGLGQGGAIALVADLIISSAPAEKTGSVSAAQEVSAELGSALGIAAGGAAGTAIYRASLTGSMPPEIDGGSADTALSSSVNTVSRRTRVVARIL